MVGFSNLRVAEHVVQRHSDNHKSWRLGRQSWPPSQDVFIDVHFDAAMRSWQRDGVWGPRPVTCCVERACGSFQPWPSSWSTDPRFLVRNARQLGTRVDIARFLTRRCSTHSRMKCGSEHHFNAGSEEPTAPISEDDVGHWRKNQEVLLPFGWRFVSRLGSSVGEGRRCTVSNGISVSWPPTLPTAG